MTLSIVTEGEEGHHVTIDGVDEGGLPRVLAELRFQLGPRGEVGVNGVQEMDLLRVCLDRLERFQAGRFPCESNRLAIEGIKAAMAALDDRTRDRVERGVEGFAKA